MTAIYDPWHVQPRQLPSNLIPRSEAGPSRSASLVTRGADESVATNSPPVVIVQVRMRLDEQHIQFETLPHFDASPSPAAGHWRGGRRLTWRSLLASFSRGPSGRNHNSLGLLARWSSKPLFHLRQEPSSGIAYRFKFLRWLVALVHDENSNRGDEYAARQRFFQNRKQLFRG